MSDLPLRFGDMNVVIVQPSGCDEEEYWGGVDEDPSALVHVMILEDEVDEDGDRVWHSFVFSTRERATEFILKRNPTGAMLSTLVIDDPDYGNRSDA